MPLIGTALTSFFKGFFQSILNGIANLRKESRIKKLEREEFEKKELKHALETSKNTRQVKKELGKNRELDTILNDPDL